MDSTSSIERTDPPLLAPETDTLRGYLDYHRATLRMKAEGLDQLREAIDGTVGE